jgi:RNA polymerase sigma factor (sigma-70 family)
MAGLADGFEAHRERLNGVALRMLGSKAEAEDAVQETWLRLSRVDSDAVANLGGWLTTVVARVCLDMLRSRKSRREDELVPRLQTDAADPEQTAMVADAIGPALLIVLEHLAPAERVAFVLHDMFAVPFEEIAPIVDKTPAAARQLASRARRRVRGQSAAADYGPAERRSVVEAFVKAVRSGDMKGLLAVLDPSIVVRGDAYVQKYGGPAERRGAEDAADFLRMARGAQYVMADGVLQVAWAPEGEVRVAFELTIAAGRITAVDLKGEPKELAMRDFEVLEEREESRG